MERWTHDAVNSQIKIHTHHNICWDWVQTAVLASSGPMDVLANTPRLRIWPSWNRNVCEAVQARENRTSNKIWMNFSSNFVPRPVLIASVVKSCHTDDMHDNGATGWVFSREAIWHCFEGVKLEALIHWNINDWITIGLNVAPLMYELVWATCERASR